MLDPSMHSMPAVTAAPNGKVVACQSLDNKIVIYQVGDRFKEMRKKVFKGHMVAGYACGVDFSPEMSYLASGDGDGKVGLENLVFTDHYNLKHYYNLNNSYPIL